MSLRVTDDDGDTDILKKEIQINPNIPPVADFTWNLLSSEVNNGIIGFDAASSYDSDGSIVQYDWKWFSGDVWHNDLGSTPSHKYTSSGKYNVTLRVHDNDEATDTRTKTVVVELCTPVVDADGPYMGTVGNPIQFHGYVTCVEEPYYCHWNFGDDGTADTQNPTHTYSSSGIYLVTFTVTDSNGDVVGTDVTHAIVDTASPLVVDAGGPYSGQVNQQIHLDEGAAYGGVPPYNYHWEIVSGLENLVSMDPPDGNDDTVTVVFNSVGAYSAKLTVNDSVGTVKSDTADISVYQSHPTSDCGGGGATSSPGEAVVFAAQESQGQTLTSDCGGGGSCFLAGTKIAMADGSFKNIEDVRVGDKVKSFDPVKDIIVDSVVTKVFHHSPDEMTDYYIVVNGFLRVTPNHIMFVDGVWKAAGEIREGDVLYRLDGSIVTVNSLYPVFDRVETYNLEVAWYHTYFADGVLVHNAKRPGAQIATSSTAGCSPTSGCTCDCPVPPCGSPTDEYTPTSQECGCRNTCFPAGTKITMADGSLKSIEDIRVGDKVLSYDATMGRYVAKRVVFFDDRHTVASHAKACAELGNPPSLYTINNGLVEFTPEHPFYVRENDVTKWAALVPDPVQHPQKGRLEDLRLRVGQEILLNGNWVKIKSISVSRCNVPDVRVYNLRVEDTHTYIANGIVVHNKEDENQFSTNQGSTSPVCTCGEGGCGEVHEPWRRVYNLAESVPESSGNSPLLFSSQLSEGLGVDTSLVKPKVEYLRGVETFRSPGFGETGFLPPQNAEVTIERADFIYLGYPAVRYVEKTRIGDQSYISRILTIRSDVSQYGVLSPEKMRALYKVNYSTAKQALGLDPEYDFTIRVVDEKGAELLYYAPSYDVDSASIISSFSRNILVSPDYDAGIPYYRKATLTVTVFR